jgi:hypothetical protein
MARYRSATGRTSVASFSRRSKDTRAASRSGGAASCHTGGHEIWWTVQAETDADAARLLSF